MFFNRSFYLWGIMHSTIKKMNKHVIKLQKDVEEARDRYDAAQRRVRLSLGIDYFNMKSSINNSSGQFHSLCLDQVPVCYNIYA